MKKYSISVLIPARNEEFLAKTVENILENTEETTEVIAVLDGEWANPGLPDNERLTVVYVPKSIGQRGATKLACRLSKSKYIIKCDAHVTFGRGLDKSMLEAFKKAGDNSVIIPVMRNLWAFDWKCHDCGWKKYQGPKPEKCENCGGVNIKRKTVWIAKKSPQSVSYCYDSEPHFQYFKEYAKRPEYKKDLEETGLTKTMSIQGSFFMMTREKYWELDIDDDKGFGSWGSMGICVASKFWLSGGQVLVNHDTYYSHLFRTQKDFGFPYPQSGRAVQNAKKMARDLFFNNKWHLQTKPLSWLLDKFKPINGWTDKEIEEQKEREKNHLKFGIQANKKEEPSVNIVKKEPTKGIIYYTDNQLKLKIAHAVQDQLRTIGLPIVSSSLKPMPHFGKNIHLKGLKRGYLSMFKQILVALKNSDTDIVFFCEHDCLYSQSHFDFIPFKKDTFYYNTNVWKIRAEDGHALYYNNCRQVSGICVYKEAAIKHYEERVAYIEKNGYNRNIGFEPATSKRVQWKNEYQSDVWQSEVPNLDICHDNNLTPNRWSKDLFRNKKNCEGWTECNVRDIKGWDLDIVEKVLN
ncbi:MAG: glycosyltransferase family 2 protein [Patescibacteria group bacterium]|nr:glycosyltransferase family 2 protein [Patescibacteria group bacterium]